PESTGCFDDVRAHEKVRQVQVCGSLAVCADPTHTRSEMHDHVGPCLLEECLDIAGLGEVELLGARGDDGGASALRQLPQDGPTHKAAAAGDQYVPLAERSEHGGTIYLPTRAARISWQSGCRGRPTSLIRQHGHLRRTTERYS